MIEYSKAIETIKKRAVTLPDEKVKLTDALNRVLAVNIYSDMDMPPFNKSAVDGYACKKTDLGKILEVLEVIYAGSSPNYEVKKGQCSKIMTGASVPQGADCVFMIEDAEILPDNKVKCNNSNCKTNICYLGEDIQQGACVLEKGTLLKPKHIPVLAGAGIALAKVVMQPKVGVYATGSELVEIDKMPNTYQIRNSNSYQILAQLNDMGVGADYNGIVCDDRSETIASVDYASKNYDLSIYTGGASVGDLDLLPGVLTENGFETVFTKTAIQPGKPIIFAQNGNHFCFGLSGNPVSSFIQFELYVKLFIYGLMGFDFTPVQLKMPLTKPYSRKRNDRLQFVPAHIDDLGGVEPLPFHGSAHINALSFAHCMFEVPKGKTALGKGEMVNIRMI